MGAHEIYFTALGRKYAQVRLTGNFGSEILRGVSTYKPLLLDPGMKRCYPTAMEHCCRRTEAKPIPSLKPHFGKFHGTCMACLRQADRRLRSAPPTWTTRSFALPIRPMHSQEHRRTQHSAS